MTRSTCAPKRRDGGASASKKSGFRELAPRGSSAPAVTSVPRFISLLVATKLPCEVLWSPGPRGRPERRYGGARGIPDAPWTLLVDAVFGDRR